MYKQGNKLNKAQTALEYIAASLVFAGVGIGLFFGANQAILSTRGTEDNYGSTDTLLGKTLGGEVAQEPSGQSQEGSGEAGQDDSWIAEDRGREQIVDAGSGNSNTNLPPVQSSYSPGELQGQFNSLTNQHTNSNQAVYGQGDTQSGNQDLNEGWFMSPGGQ